MPPRSAPSDEARAPGPQSARAVARTPVAARRVRALGRLGRVWTGLLLLAGLGALLAICFHPPAILALVGLSALAGGGRMIVQNGLLVFITEEVALYTPGGAQVFSGRWAQVIGGVFVFAGLGMAALGLFLLAVALR